METNKTDVQSLIQKIMEGANPREVIDSAVNEKAGYHKEKRVRDGKVTTVNVKNTKRKKHVVLTAAQKRAIKKAHSAQVNKKRGKSLKKGAARGLYKDGVELNGEAVAEEQELNATPEVQEVAVSAPEVAPEVQAPVVEAEEEASAPAEPVIICPACGGKSVEVFVDPETGDEFEETVFVCPDCGASFVLCSADDEEEEGEDEDDEKEDAKADEAVPEDEAAEVAPEASAVAEEAPVAEECEGCDDEDEEDKDACGEPECGTPESEAQEGPIVAPAEMFFVPEI